MILRSRSFPLLGLLLVFALLLVAGAGDVLCAPGEECGREDDCGAGKGCSPEDGCDDCGCPCHVPTALFGLPHEGSPLVPFGDVHEATSRPSDGVPVSIVRPPA